MQTPLEVRSMEEVGRLTAMEMRRIAEAEGKTISLDFL